MRGPSKSFPKYAKHKASGKAVVRLNGTDIYLGPYGTKTSKLEYDRVIGEWLANGRMLPTKPDEYESITVAQLSAFYLRYAQSYYIKNGKQTDEVPGIKAAIKYLNVSYSTTMVADFGPLSLEAVRDQIIAVGNSRSYINKTANRIRRMFKWGVAKELVPVHVHQALAALPGLKKGKTKAREADPVLPIDNAVVEATLEHAPKIIEDMVRFQQLTGCRPGEVRTLRPCEIDRTTDDKTDNAPAVWQYRPESHKMEHKGRDRVILIGPKAQAILLPYLLRDESEVCFEKPTGGPFARWNYSEKINQACDKAFPAPEGTTGEDLKAWRKKHRWAPNRLRHSRATDIRQKYGLEGSQAVLGHSNADVTQIYAERDMEKAAMIMAEVS